MKKIYILLKFRQEIDVFGVNCTKQLIESVIKAFKSNEQMFINDERSSCVDENLLENLLLNLNELYEWDAKNEHCGCVYSSSIEFFSLVHNYLF